jgi:hypothetical protein
VPVNGPFRLVDRRAAEAGVFVGEGTGVVVGDATLHARANAELLMSNVLTRFADVAQCRANVWTHFTDR